MRLLRDDDRSKYGSCMCTPSGTDATRPRTYNFCVLQELGNEFTYSSYIPPIRDPQRERPKQDAHAELCIYWLSAHERARRGDNPEPGYSVEGIASPGMGSRQVAYEPLLSAPKATRIRDDEENSGTWSFRTNGTYLQYHDRDDSDVNGWMDTQST